MFISICCCSSREVCDRVPLCILGRQRRIVRHTRLRPQHWHRGPWLRKLCVGSRPRYYRTVLTSIKNIEYFVYARNLKKFDCQSVIFANIFLDAKENIISRFCGIHSPDPWHRMPCFKFSTASHHSAELVSLSGRYICYHGPVRCCRQGSSSFLYHRDIPIFEFSNIFHQKNIGLIMLLFQNRSNIHFRFPCTPSAISLIQEMVLDCTLYIFVIHFQLGLATHIQPNPKSANYKCTKY